MRSSTVQILVGTAFAGLLLTFGFGLSGYFSLSFLMFGVLCSAFVLNLALQNQKRHSVTKNEARIIAVLLALLGATGVFFYWQDKRPPSSPKVALYLQCADFPTTKLWLTNSFLFAEQNTEGFELPKRLQFLVVETASSLPHANLRFGILNDGASESQEVERPQIRVWLGKPELGQALNWSADIEWKRVTVETNFEAGVLHRFPRSLPPRTADLTPAITFDIQEKPIAFPVVVAFGGKGVPPVAHCFKLLIVPSDEPTTKLRFDTNEVIEWNWKYRPVAYRPLDTPLAISPSRVQLSDGTNTFGSNVKISNLGDSNLYAITASIEIESNTVPIASPTIDLSKPREREEFQRGEMPVMFEAGFDFVGISQSRLFVIPVLQAKESRVIWIKGNVLTNSFAVISVWQAKNSFPSIKYLSDGTWMWPVLSSNSAWWTHTGAQPMDLDFGIRAWYGTNGVTNGPTIPSHP